MIRRSHSRMSGKILKRSGSPQSPPLPTKSPKITLEEATFEIKSTKMNIEIANVDKLKVAELRTVLSSHELDTKGTKPILVERLKSYLEGLPPKDPNAQVVEAAAVAGLPPKNMSKKNDTPSNNVMMEKLENIEEKLENYESSNKDMKVTLASNMAAIDGLNTKLDKISQLLGVLTKNGGKMNEAYPETKIFYSFYGNIMTCESFFDMEGLMTNYGITGKNVTSQILSYLDFDSMVAARMVSKTWYRFLEDERGLWINLMKKCFEDIKEKRVRYQSSDGERNFQFWQQLQDIIEKNGENVADIVTLIPRMDYYDITYSLPVQIIRNWESAVDNSKNLSQNLRFLKLLGKYNFFHGLGVTYYPSCLLSWSLIDLEALKFVVPVLQKEINYKLEDYGFDWGKSPLWAAIRKTENGVEKLKMLIPLATKKFWNSGKPIGSIDHTPLADAIMIGNVEMVRTIMPLTRLKANPKNRFGSYLHVAVRYGQFEIFKIIFNHLKEKKFDWLQLKDQEERTALEMLQDESFQLENYNRDLEKPVRADRDESKKYKQHMLKFIENLM